MVSRRLQVGSIALIGIEFKLQALSYKSYDLPNLPELKADFLRRY